MEKNQELQLRALSTGLIATLNDPEHAREFERSLTIKKIVESAMPLCEVVRLTSSRAVAQTLDAALTKLVAAVNVSQNLNDGQIKTIVEDLIDKYPNESIEDFILVFKKARQGEFGIIYSLHSAVIFGWMEFYLEEKYQAVERKLMLEKDKPYELPEPVEDGKGYAEFKEWAKEFTKKSDVRPITGEDIKREGKTEMVKKRSIYYPSSTQSKADEIAERVERGRKIHELSKKYPTLSMEELKAMVTN